ncbi:OV-16 antigen 1 [Aphelenchoides avenae]|nr:OV-16 antigen 1 [Aphelenchus avenae]
MRFLAAFVAVTPYLLFGVEGDSPTAKAFIRYKIVPDIIVTPPVYQIYARFPSGSQVRLGNSLSGIRKLQAKPAVSWEFAAGANYTFMTVDPDAPAPNHPFARSWVHWLVVNVPGDRVAQGQVIQEYNGPLPPSRTGLHRYVLLAYEQPALINPQYSGIDGFNVQNFVNANNLKQPPLAGNFFRSQHD